MPIKRVFFAYPSYPTDLVSTISAAVEKSHKINLHVRVEPWSAIETSGLFIPDQVRSAIEDCDAFAFDITTQNKNVLYEAGFAIAVRKPVLPVVNVSFQNATEIIQRDGLFDNIGYERYENSSQLADAFENISNVSILDLYSRQINRQQPFYILDTYRKTDFRNEIISSLKEARGFYRSFDPVEIPRFSTVTAIGDVTSSIGVIIPILSTAVDDSERHNLRAAFLAGLSHGLGRETLIVERDHGGPGPADYRNNITTVRSEVEIIDAVSNFVSTALVEGQSLSSPRMRVTRTGLQALDLGSSAAENEFRTLGDYFVQTFEFLRTVRGQARVLTGRKGSGKTAIFFQARDTFRAQKNVLIIDLKPESHQLSLFRQELLKIVEIGVFDHTLAAFWQFVLLSEILYALKKDKEKRSRFDAKALEQVFEIEKVLEGFKFVQAGDFTARINRLGNDVIAEVTRLRKRGEALSPERLTNVVFKGGIVETRSLILQHLPIGMKTVVLFDNIDKGWPANGVDRFDARLTRLLLEALDKIRRDFENEERELVSVVFLRNDIYELLVDETPDRGKAGELRIDWTDRSKLRQVIHRRLQTSARDENASFEDIWSRYFVNVVLQQNSFEYLIDHCLMRPRFLINIVENAIANAINRGHSRVEEVDCIDAVRQHSFYLTSDFGYEIRDVSGLPHNILLAFSGATKLLTESEVLECLRHFGIENENLNEAFRLLRWYGVLGVGDSDGNERFIYDFEYNVDRLQAEIRREGENMLYVVNPAIHISLRNFFG